MPMIEIGFQGRGGQGVVVGSEILGRACFEEGNYPQCYSLFGGERRGAPVVAFVRVSDKKIYLKCDIERPDHLVLFDPALFYEKQIREQVADGGVLLFNAENIRTTEALKAYKVGKINALEISRRNGLGPIVNTAILGAYVGLTQVVKLDTLLKTIKKNIPSDIDQNINAAREAHEEVSIL